MDKPSFKNVSHVPTSLQFGSPTQQPFLPYATTEQAYCFGLESRFPMLSVMDGIEVAEGNIADIATGERGFLTQRHEGMQRSKDIIYEQIADNQFPLDESEFIVGCLKRRSDASVRQTYHEGKRVNEISEAAATPRIGITFMAGADIPQVNRMEQLDMTNKTPEQKSALWRVNTAGTLLNDFEVGTDLSIIQSDNTSQVITRYRERNLIIDRPCSASSSAKHALVARGLNDKTVTIHSDHVEIVSDLSVRKWDLESTLIEVDGSSLTNLIVNYRHLIYRGGPTLTFNETVKLLDIMIEDARRLCVRSPILFRMSTRRHIVSSKNTRYGVDHGLMFRTLTTSRGIKNIISLSASYFNALSTPGNRDKSQDLIRPKFWQMLVLLLSLLNDEDLNDLKEFVQTTYRIKADRQSLELLILKVLPLMSINSTIFINAMVTAVEGFNGETELDTEQQDQNWATFVQRLLHLGYVLPGTVSQLGQNDLSWIIKWPDDGVKDSHLLRNLQYGNKSWVMNEIPSLDLTLDSTLEDVTVILTNGARYIIGHDDLERITCMTPGKCCLTDTIVRGQICDLDIKEEVVNSTVYDAIFRLNRIITEYNSSLSAPRRHNSVLARFAALREKQDMTPLKEIKGSGRLTRNVATLNTQVLAVAYKVEGRKITRRDLLRHLASDTKTVSAVARMLESLLEDLEERNISANVEGLINQRRKALARVQDKISQAEDTRKRLSSQNHADISDEPISKVIYPNGSQQARIPIWHDYRSWYVSGQNTLHVEAQRHIVDHVRWVSDCIIETGFFGSSATYLLSPLSVVAEGERADEIRLDDPVLLVGQYIVIVDPGDGHSPQDREAITNWLKIIGVEQCPVSRRGMNKRGSASKVLPRWTFR